jgi:hypothetical protein
MRVALAGLWEMFKPPSGVQARRVVMAFTLLVMAGRFGLTRLTSLGSASRINVVPAWQYGVAFLLLFVALAWTTDGRRLTMAGFVTSVFGFALYVVQAFDVWPVFPSDAYYALMALILLAEAAIIWKVLHHANR